jgi:hypothetical protein
MYRDRLGFSRFVLDRTKRQAPGWCENYKKQDGPEPGLLRAAGMLGKRPACQSNRSRQFNLERFKSLQPLEAFKTHDRAQVFIWISLQISEIVSS